MTNRCFIILSIRKYLSAIFASSLHELTCHSQSQPLELVIKFSNLPQQLWLRYVVYFHVSRQILWVFLPKRRGLWEKWMQGPSRCLHMSGTCNHQSLASRMQWVARSSSAAAGGVLQRGGTGANLTTCGPRTGAALLWVGWRKLGPTHSAF